MNENSTKKAYLKEQLAQTDTVLTTKLARVGTTMVAILLGLLLVACPSDSSNGGTGSGNGGGNGGPTTIAVPGLDNFTLAVSDDAGTEVTLTWQYPATSGIATVEITFAANPAVSINAPTTTTVVTGLTAGTEYSGSVVTIDAEANRSEATTFAYTPVDPAPAEVTGFSGSGASDATGTGVTLNWTNPTVTDLASVEISYTGGGTPASATGGATTINVTTLTSGTSYTFSAVAIDVGGNRSGAVDAAVMTSPGPPIAIWALASQDGDFGFTACQNDLDAGSTTSGTALQQAIYAAGYRNAYFFGSTNAYDYSALATGDADGLNLTATQAAQTGTGTVNVTAYAGDGSTPTTTFVVGSAAAASQTIGELIGGVSTTGSAAGEFSTAGAAVMAVANTAGPFWSFTQGVAYSAFNCSGATSNGSGSADGDRGARGSATRVGPSTASNSGCSGLSPVVCVAR